MVIVPPRADLGGTKKIGYFKGLISVALNKCHYFNN
jgi:hypothetical protein